MIDHQWRRILVEEERDTQASVVRWFVTSVRPAILAMPYGLMMVAVLTPREDSMTVKYFILLARVILDICIGLKAFGILEGLAVEFSLIVTHLQTQRPLDTCGGFFSLESIRVSTSHRCPKISGRSVQYSNQVTCPKTPLNRRINNVQHAPSHME